MNEEKFYKLQEINDRMLVVSLALAYGIHLEEEEHEKLMGEWLKLKRELEAGEVSE